MAQELMMDRKTEDAMNTARMLYALHGATFLLSLGTLSIIPLILNYIKRPESEGTLVYSHHGWMIRSFWWYACLMLLAWLLVVTFIGAIIGFPMMGIVWLWKAYRLARGFIDLNNNKPMP